MSHSVLKKWFPTTTFPFIAGAPMWGVASSGLASAVSKAGGFGFIGAGFDLSPDSAQLAALATELTRTRELLALATDAPLPIGVGFITFHPSAGTSGLSSLEPILTQHKPQAIWLFAPQSADVHATLIPGIKSIGAPWGLKVFVQVGNVEAARGAVRDGADVIVAQGPDAGGHQYKRSAGFATLVPEVVDAVTEEVKGEREVGIIAAGGIVEGRGLAAALAAGAGGVVMGTRFIVSDEGNTPDWRKKLLVETKDGSQNTVKTSFFDELPGKNVWPAPYDGRAVVNVSYKEHLDGMPMEKSSELFKAAAPGENGDRVSVWAGAGVGLIKSVEPAGDIVRSVQDEARRVLRSLAALEETSGKL